MSAPLQWWPAPSPAVPPHCKVRMQVAVAQVPMRLLSQSCLDWSSGYRPPLGELWPTRLPRPMIGHPFSRRGCGTLPGSRISWEMSFFVAFPRLPRKLVVGSCLFFHKPLSAKSYRQKSDFSCQNHQSMISKNSGYSVLNFWQPRGHSAIKARVRPTF